MPVDDLVTLGATASLAMVFSPNVPTAPEGLSYGHILMVSLKSNVAWAWTLSDWDWDWDWDKFIQHNMTLYRCMISDIHDSSYVLFRTNLISNTSLHVGRPLLRPCLVAYAEATLARQKDSATNEKCWHHFRILIVDKWSVVWNECKKSWVPNDRLEKPLIPCNMISN